MSNKTVIQECIERSSKLDFLRWFFDNKERLLQKEKEQLTEAYCFGIAQLDNSFILSANELKELLEKAFSNGALSHAIRNKQIDTCWSNLNKDMEKEVSAILSDLTNIIK